jgi:uncharacterized membrane protein YhaH (DUF805 family)
MNWFVSGLKRYAVFRGRAGRPEYWYFTLIYFLVALVLGALDFIAGTYNPESGTGLFSSIFAIVLLIPVLAVTVRRLHDTGRSGWWLLIGLLPLIGFIVLLIFTLQRGTAGANAYGEGPEPAL